MYPQMLAVLRTIMVLGVLSSLTACQPNHTQVKAETNDSLAFSSYKSLNYGRQSAAYYHLSTVWHVTHIDDVPLTRPAHIDLRQLNQGQAYVYLHEACPPISVVFNVHRIASGELYVTRIERMINDCSDEFEDSLMSIVADTRRLIKGRNANEITLISYQHTLTLSNATP